jgi:putative ABC transport system permease protein
MPMELLPRFVPVRKTSEMRGIRRLLRLRFTRAQLARDIDEELLAHIARRADALMCAGLSREDAFAEAQRRFGDVARVRDRCLDEDHRDLRRANVMTFIEQLSSDARFALRSLKRAKGFTMVALATLVLGIASFTSIFSYLNAVYFAALPYHQASRSVALSEHRPANRFVPPFSAVSLVAVEMIRESRHSFERVTAYDERYSTVLFGREPRSVRTLSVDTAFIPFFDLHPEIGRLLTAEEITSNAAVVMISEVLWRSAYGADPDAIGKTIVLEERPFRIIGVMQAGFRFPYQTDAIYPLREAADSGSTTRETYISLLGRLRPGVNPTDARNELAVVARRLADVDAKAYRNVRLVVRDELLDRRGQQFLPLPGVFLSAGLLLLLITCANVANLFFVRAAERRGEMAIRSSLGAGRARLVRQALTESLLVGGVAAALGTWLSTLLVKLWLLTIPTRGFPSWFHVNVDVRVLAFAIGVTALVTLAVGLAPAFEGTRFNLTGALKVGADHGTSNSHATRGSKRGLVIQLALSVALFVAASLLIRSFQQLTKYDFGYPAEQIATIEPLYTGRIFEQYATRMRFAQDVATRSTAVPGVDRVAIRGNFVAMRQTTPKSADPTNPLNFRFIPDGDTTRAVWPQTSRTWVVSDQYFDMLELAAISGRTFDATDAANSAPAALVSARMAELLWGRQSPIGRTIQIGLTGPPLLIVGVVEDVRQFTGGGRGFRVEREADVYLSTRQALSNYPAVLARATGNVGTARTAIVNLVREADPSLIISNSATLASVLDQAFLVTRVFGGIILALASSALLLSVIGIYGIAAFGITRRTREIGIRIALGGTIERVIQMITLETLRFVAIGLAIGLVLAVGFARLLSRFLFGVSPLDPIAYVAVAFGFGSVALLASYWPARRVARVDPLVALRSE